MFEKMKSLRIGSREVLGAVEKMGCVCTKAVPQAPVISIMFQHLQAHKYAHSHTHRVAVLFAKWQACSRAFRMPITAAEEQTLSLCTLASYPGSWWAERKSLGMRLSALMHTPQSDEGGRWEGGGGLPCFLTP